MVWVPAETGSHLGDHWVEVDESAQPAPGPNVQRANAEQLQREAQSMGDARRRAVGHRVTLQSRRVGTDTQLLHDNRWIGCDRF